MKSAYHINAYILVFDFLRFSENKKVKTKKNRHKKKHLNGAFLFINFNFICIL